ncbi:MAG TPA: hypothetical protein VFS94_09535 [Gemmatimonadales bacterium]|nr:hypothetical protein [Gemmatimonadales bacterium]
MSFWSRLFGPRETPEETVQRTRRALELMDSGKTDEEVERALYMDGVPVERARALVAEVRRVKGER